MKEELICEIKEIFYTNEGYARASEISERGINRYYLSELVESGYITKVKKGLYKWNEYGASAGSEIADVLKIVPKGVVCLTSALAYHELTTYNPWQYEIAVERSSKIVLPEFPPIKLVYFSRSFYELGITEIEVDGQMIKIYDMEKTICDCVRYRNKIGIEIIKESLNKYVKRKDKNYSKLMEYAQKCRVAKILKQYLEVLA